MIQFWNDWFELCLTRAKPEKGTTVKTIERQYISLAENRQEHYNLQDSSRPIVTTWTATVEGNLSTGEHVYMYREGATSEEAYRALEAALNEQKWTIEV